LGSSFPYASVCELRNNTRSSASICFCLTFLSLHALISFWQDYRFLTAFMCSGSSKSFDSALVELYMASTFVMALCSLISSGVTGLFAIQQPERGEICHSANGGVMTPYCPQQLLCSLDLWLVLNIFFIAENMSAFAFSTVPLE
jgi:hypothetical protein